jgi:hypothetical protein
MGHNREDDADHDADQRHDVSDAKCHFLSPFFSKFNDSKGEGGLNRCGFCLDRRGSFSTINLYFFNERSYFHEATRQEIGSIIQFGSPPTEA